MLQTTRTRDRRPSGPPAATTPTGTTLLDDYHLPNLGTRLPTRWAPNGIVVDRTEVTLPAGAPAGRYGLLAGFGDEPAAQSRDGRSRLLGRRVPRQRAPAVARRARGIGRRLCPRGLRYRSTARLRPRRPGAPARPPRRRARVPSDVARDRLGSPGADGRARRAGRHVRRRLARGGGRPPRRGWPPPTGWSVPADAPPGTYSVFVLWPGRLRSPRASTLARRRSGHGRPPARVRPGRPAGGVVPADVARTDVAFGPSIRLVGYSQALAGETLAVTLYWTSATRPAEDETVFVQVTSPDGDAARPERFAAARRTRPHHDLAAGRDRRRDDPDQALACGATGRDAGRDVPHAGPRAGTHRRRPRLLSARLGGTARLPAACGPLRRRHRASGLPARPPGGGADSPAKLTLVWSADRRPSRAYQVFVHVVDAVGQSAGAGGWPARAGTAVDRRVADRRADTSTSATFGCRQARSLESRGRPV